MIGLVTLCAIVLSCAGEEQEKGRGLSGESNPNGPTRCSEPRFFVQQGAYEDNSEFWSSLASNMSKAYGMGRAANAQPCRQYGDEESFLAVLSIVQDKEDPSTSDLQEKVSAFCETHSDDSRVDEAYNCSTGCPLADLLNQVCLQARPPPCIEPVSSCTNIYALDTLACGKEHQVSLDKEYGYVHGRCGYPRCPGACDFTLTVGGVHDADLHRLGVDLTYYVTCPDTITIYGGSARNDDNILLNSTCFMYPKNVYLPVKLRTFTVALDKSPEGFGWGFRISSHILR